MARTLIEAVTFARARQQQLRDMQKAGTVLASDELRISCSLLEGLLQDIEQQIGQKP